MTGCDNIVVDLVLIVAVAVLARRRAALHLAAELHLALEQVELALECEQTTEALGALGEHLLQAVEVLQHLGLRRQRAAVGDERPLNPYHQVASPAWPTGAGEAAIDALYRVSDGDQVGRVQARFEQLRVVGLERLSEDGGEGLEGGRRNDGACGLHRSAGYGLLEQAGHVNGLVAAQKLAKRGGAPFSI
ncbi:hypothetical protein CRV24_007773 [Beauveria bassiana]|nr:hypothetical protein CRV24_007773 [Beauveria bassiana]KAH8715813.1 hypothetical protein HC256_004605 [Beauveria bassiana]